MDKQVDKSHYMFQSYLDKLRWASIWHQVDEVLRLKPGSVLEIGPGPGIFKAVVSLFDVSVETLDIDPELHPDHVGSAESMPFKDNSYDIVCAFQVLEHVPFNTSLRVFSQMCRVAKRHVVISLPDARPAWPYSLYIPKLGRVRFLIPRPWTGPKDHVFRGEHYWEVNKKGYSMSRVTSELCQSGHSVLQKSFRVPEYPYHRFFVFSAA